MRRAIAIIGLALAATVLQGGTQPAPAKCAVCFTGGCYTNAMCFRGCFCMKRGMDIEGACFSTGYAPEGYEPVE